MLNKKGFTQTYPLPMEIKTLDDLKVLGLWFRLTHYDSRRNYRIRKLVVAHESNINERTIRKPLKTLKSIGVVETIANESLSGWDGHNWYLHPDTENNYALIPNDVLYCNVKPEVIGLYVFLLLQAPTFREDTSANKLSKKLKVTRNALTGIFNKLSINGLAYYDNKKSSWTFMEANKMSEFKSNLIEHFGTEPIAPFILYGTVANGIEVDYGGSLYIDEENFYCFKGKSVDEDNNEFDYMGIIYDGRIPTNLLDDAEIKISEYLKSKEYKKQALLTENYYPSVLGYHLDYLDISESEEK